MRLAISKSAWRRHSTTRVRNSRHKSAGTRKSKPRRYVRIQRVHTATAEDLFVFLEGLDAQRQTKEQTVRGYKVNVEFKPVPESAKNPRKQSRGRTILETMKTAQRINQL